MTQGHETKVSNFDEWYFKQNHLGIEPIDYARESYKAGAASRQAEINLLEKEIIETQEFLNNQNCIKQAEIDELQKRVKELELINFDSELHFDAAKEHIDHLQKRLVDVINTIESSEEISHMLYRKVYKILKGGGDE